MKSRSVELLHPLLAYGIGLAIAEYKMRYPEAPEPFIDCTHRDNAEQEKLFNQPFDKKDNDGDGKIDEADEKVTNAKPGQSAHNFNPSMAVDIAFKDKSGKLDWSVLHFQRFAAIMLKTPGITWGGHFKSIKDNPHFELTDWAKRAAKKQLTN